jgi:predicted SAM-dependent methyltransferase
MDANPGQKLNLGCGDRFIETWTNIDFKSRSPKVAEHDLREPLPFKDRSFSVVYHSHVLEHLDPGVAKSMVGECHRVLESGGVLRVVVPDLETKAILYLEKLRAAADSQNSNATDEYEWMLLEMIDQLVRKRRGGEMVAFMQSGRAADFVLRRIGDEYVRARYPQPARSVGGQRIGFFARQSLRARRRLMALLGVTPAEQDALEFQRIGETHCWMYDRVSLAALLKAAGFTDVRQEAAGTSRIPGWNKGHDYLDLDPNGARKPDSLYMEGLKP